MKYVEEVNIIVIELQREPRTKEYLIDKISSDLINPISDRTFSNIIKEARKERGMVIKYNKSRGVYEIPKGKYTNTIHPVHLDLNLTELYFLMVYLKELIDSAESGDYKSEVQKLNENFYRSIMNKIYPQLSNYAKDTINRNLPPNFYKEDYSMNYESEEALFKKMKEVCFYTAQKARRGCSLVMRFRNGEETLEGEFEIGLSTGCKLTVTNGDKWFFISEDDILEIYEIKNFY